jgi:hypothetical protein
MYTVGLYTTSYRYVYNIQFITVEAEAIIDHSLACHDRTDQISRWTTTTHLDRPAIKWTLSCSCRPISWADRSILCDRSGYCSALTFHRPSQLTGNFLCFLAGPATITRQHARTPYGINGEKTPAWFVDSGHPSLDESRTLIADFCWVFS